MLSSGFDGSGQSIAFLSVACVFVLVTGLAIYWAYYCTKNPVDYNIANQKNWFFKWLYKSRLSLSYIVAVLCLLITIFFFLAAFGIIIPLDTPD